MSDDFYIGYRKTAPPALAGFVRIATVSIVLATIATAGFIGSAQRPAAKGTYEFGTTTEFEATLVMDPVPLALVHTEDSVPAGDRPALLVTQGKHGTHPEAFSNDAKEVRFTGTRIERDGVHMIELAGPRKFEVISSVTAPAVQSIPQEVSFEGELIDTKCYLGVMNPAEGKVHRGCASLCLRGGVPPGLLVRDTAGRARVVVLNTRISGAPTLNPEWAGRVLRVSGTLETFLGLPVLNVREMSLR